MASSTTPPYTNNTNQQNLNVAVTNYDWASYQRDEDTQLRLAYLSTMLALMACGCTDEAFVVAQTEVLPMVIQDSIDEQNEYAYSEGVTSAIDAFSTDEEELFDAGGDGSTDEDGISEGGMTEDQADQFYEDQADLQWDLTSDAINPATGENTSYLWMIDSTNEDGTLDTTFRDTLLQTIEDTMSQYNIEADQMIPENEDADTDTILNKTNEWWSLDGSKSEGKGPPQPINDILSDFQTATNTCNGQEQSANSLFENQVQITNSYMGGLEDAFAETQDIDATADGNLKS